MTAYDTDTIATRRSSLFAKQQVPTGFTSMHDRMISPRQCRAARFWLGLTQRKMATKAGVDMQTIMHFELGRGTPRKATILALMTFFLKVGIRIDDRQNLVLPQVLDGAMGIVNGKRRSVGRTSPGTIAPKPGSGSENRMGKDTGPRIDRVLYGGELRSDFVRAAIEKELQRREREAEKEEA